VTVEDGHKRLLVVEDEALVLGLNSAKTWARPDYEHGKGELRKSLPIQEKENMRRQDRYNDACDFIP